MMTENNETIVLKEPIKRGEKEITEVMLREPKAGELRGVNLSDLLQMDVVTVGKVLERVSDPMIDSRTFAKLNPVDLTNLSVGLVSFFVDTRSTLTA